MVALLDRRSYLANHLKEPQLRAWFGWVQRSDVPARYVHLSGRDIDNAYDEMHGLYESEEDGDEPQVRECSLCEEFNEPKAAFCMRCGYALKGESAADFEAEVEDDVKQSYADIDPEDADTKEKLDALHDPDVKTALLNRIGDWRNANG